MRSSAWAACRAGSLLASKAITSRFRRLASMSKALRYPARNGAAVEIIKRPTFAGRFSIHCQVSGARVGNTHGGFARTGSDPRHAISCAGETGGGVGAVDEDGAGEVPAGL